MSRAESMVGRFIEYKQALGYDFSGEAQRLRAFVAFLGGRDATEDEALAWAAGGRGHPRSYQAQRYETVRRFSEFAHALDPSFPSMRPGLLGSTSDRVVPYIYTEDDACVLMRAALSLNSPDGLRGAGLSFLIGLMWSCGLRVSEALGLADADFDAGQGTLAIRDSKFGASRLIPVAEDVARHIVDYRDSRDATLRMRNPPRLVVSTGGMPLTRDSAEGMFSEIRWSLLDRGRFFVGRKPRLHDLRHSCASLLLKNGVPMKQIQEWLGHSDISTTSSIYAHLDYSSKVLSASTMEGALKLPELNLTKSWD